MTGDKCRLSTGQGQTDVPLGADFRWWSGALLPTRHLGAEHLPLMDLAGTVTAALGP